jgi:hypothetical protein
MAGRISHPARQWRSLGQAIAQGARADAADEADFPIKTPEDTGDVCGGRAQRLRQVRDRVRPLAQESEKLFLLGGQVGVSCLMSHRSHPPQPPMWDGGTSEWI